MLTPPAVACALALLQGTRLELDLRPGPVAVDRFHPERSRLVEPRAGGDVVLQVPSLPASLNAMIESSGVARQILYELHDSLVRRDWETWDYLPSLAERFLVEDVLVLETGECVVGRLEEDGEHWTLHTRVPVEGRSSIDRSVVERVERAAAFTFVLRKDVRWHDGHPFDARDVLFSFRCFKNPDVRCERKRYLFDKIVAAEQLDQYVVRFRFDHSYFLALSAFDESFTILPSHLYEITDPDHPAHEDVVTPERQAAEVNDSAHNREWIGLGPYRLVEWNKERLSARRVGPCDGTSCFLDEIHWRALADTKAATTALLEGELDFFDRLGLEDYFGALTRDEAFTRRLYTGFFFTPALNVTVWNTTRPELADARVRRALGMCFDWRRFVDGYYKGLALRVTGEQMPFGPSYDRALEELPFDPDAAKRLLAEAGWIDRDGDGRVDKDGRALELSYLFAAGNETSSSFGELLQAELTKIGVRLVLQPRDNAGLVAALRAREFDSVALGLALPFQSDPEQLWHSKWADSSSANRSGLKNAEVDALIERLQREVHPDRRDELLRSLQRRIYELQPVMFGVWGPHRFGASRSLRGIQLFALDPGYSIRRWYRE